MFTAIDPPERTRELGPAILTAPAPDRHELPDRIARPPVERGRPGRITSTVGTRRHRVVEHPVHSRVRSVAPGVLGSSVPHPLAEVIAASGAMP